jgi:hypothetical protein
MINILRTIIKPLKSIMVANSIFLLALLHFYGYAVASTDIELFNQGKRYYESKDYMKAAMYLYAYIERNPFAVQNDKTHEDEVLTAIQFCTEQLREEIDRADSLEKMYSKCLQDSGKPLLSVYTTTISPPTLNNPKATTPPKIVPESICGMEWNTDRPGSDYNHYPLPKDDPNLCRNACMDEPSCKAWTYVRPNTLQGPNPMCWLKNATPPPIENPYCLSGVK